MDKNRSRDHDEVLRDAIRLLTDAARLSRPILVQNRDTQDWATDPARSERSDFAEFLTLAVAAVAANVGGVEELLAGRSGSWEADHMRNMLHATVGYEDAQLLAHRTEPVVLTVDTDAILWDIGIGALYDESQREVLRQQLAVSIDCVLADDGDLIPCDPSVAPLPPEVQARIRVERGDGWWRPGVRTTVFATAEQEAAFDRLCLLDELVEELRARETAEFGEAFKASVLAELEREPIAGLHVPVEVRVVLDQVGYEAEGGWPLFATRLYEAAWLTTPLPGSGIAVQDYPAGLEVAQVERQAGRMPHQRLQGPDPRVTPAAQRPSSP